MSGSHQAWVLSMTSGVASALGAATLYLDPLLHKLGIPEHVNILESHTVLSALLAGASGIMAYTSISSLTGESIDYLTQYKGWPIAQQYPGAVSAVLFLLGAHLNLLLVKTVAYLTPSDSPIKHSCASHSPSEEELQVGASHGRDPSTGNTSTRSLVGTPAGIDERRPLLGSIASVQPSPLVNRFVTPMDSMSNFDGDITAMAATDRDDSSPEIVLRHHHRCDCHCASECPDLYIPGRNGECEYACTKRDCYQFEHCHITPLYPHPHTHGVENNGIEQLAHGGHCYSPVINGNPGKSADHHNHSHVCGKSATPAGSVHSSVHIDEVDEHHAHHPHHHHHHHHHDDDDEHETEGDSRTAAEISTQHHRLLLHVGLQTAVAIALHKIPEGLIIYMSRRASPKLGVSVAASLFFHNLPEGLMLALPLFLATGRRTQAFLVSSLMGAVPPFIGATIGWFIVDDVLDDGASLAGVFGVAFGIIAGMMSMVALNGMLPTARIYDKSGNVVAWWFAFGIAAMLFANSTLK